MLKAVDELTKEVLHQRAVDSTLLKRTKGDDRRCDFTQTELFGRSGEGVVWVRCSALQLTEDLGVGQHLSCHHLFRPPLLRYIVYRLVENVVVAKCRIGTRQAGVVLEDIVNVELFESEESRVRFWIGNDCLLPHKRAERRVEVQTIFQTLDYVLLGKVTAIAGKKAVVR